MKPRIPKQSNKHLFQLQLLKIYVEQEHKTRLPKTIEDINFFKNNLVLLILDKLRQNNKRANNHKSRQKLQRVKYSPAGNYLFKFNNRNTRTRC